MIRSRQDFLSGLEGSNCVKGPPTTLLVSLTNKVTNITLYYHLIIINLMYVSVTSYPSVMFLLLSFSTTYIPKKSFPYYGVHVCWLVIHLHTLDLFLLENSQNCFPRFFVTNYVCFSEIVFLYEVNFLYFCI